MKEDHAKKDYQIHAKNRKQDVPSILLAAAIKGYELAGNEERVNVILRPKHRPGHIIHHRKQSIRIS
jgi:hypothetical protein